MANNENLVPFKKGYDPRRGSKRKGSRHLSSIIRDMASDPKFSAALKDASTGAISFEGAPIHAIVGVALLRAVHGDRDARDWIAKYGWWKLPPEPDPILPNPIQFINLVPTSDNEPGHSTAKNLKQEKLGTL
jgi:hypothetical protein